MTLDQQLGAMEVGVGSFTLPNGDLLRLVGSDSLAAVDRVVSQDVKALADGAGRLALLLAPKGQFRALLAVFRTGDDVVLLAPRGRGSELAARLGTYLKLSRVAVAPHDWQSGATLLVGPGWRSLAERLGLNAAPVAAGGCAAAGAPGERLLWLGQTLAGVEGAVVVAEAESSLGSFAAALSTAGTVEIGEPALELERIRRGFPAWGRELTETVLPPEVGLEKLAISYTKGCYIGQETIARMRTYGHPNRALVGVRHAGGADGVQALPLPLFSPGDSKVRGQLTSLARHPVHGAAGLALVRREFATPGATLSGAGRTWTVAALPLW